MSKITFGAVGDISFCNLVDKKIQEYGPAYPFEHIRESLDKADVLFGNQESVMLPDDFPLEKTGGNGLQSRDFVYESLKTVGFDILNHAANHVLDCGWQGLLCTRQKIIESGALPIGTGKNQAEARTMQVIEKKGVRFGFLGYHQAGDWTLEGGGGRIAYLRRQDVLEDIRKNRDKVDILVISIHGDIEFREAPCFPRYKLCREIAENGADIILCHHPHVPQGVEKWRDCLIHYSLGNLVFNINGYQLNNTPNCRMSHMFFVDIEDKKIKTWRREYFRIREDEGRPYPISENLDEEDKYYRELDCIVADPEAVRKVWHETCMTHMQIHLNRLHESKYDARDFIKHYGKYFFSDMCREYLDGIYELAGIEYKKNASNDFEFMRPYAPYEG